ncbi:alpha/beta hydrolase [Hoeflea olei]|uniref:Serine aminopeptidase S33 domain-containing protein n=1 Tax=Hoeflea olei TaxID=1480615 RepID=A0A1C1YZ27_9HYPH|nr:alpha/beta fold hydrolase [Hoeflea olei]OCW58758.1 hypothetical protein AWJ14_00590 [Hoeflea olei]
MASAPPAGPHTTPQAPEERELACGALHGTLALPRGIDPTAAALIIPGSGSVDRNGDLPGLASGFLRQLAHELARQGVATLRIDKRGIGKSAGFAENELRFGQMVTDAVAWSVRLRAEVPARPLLLIGHSEGALVATMAARTAAVDGLVLLAGAGSPAHEVILRQLDEAGLPLELRDHAQRIIGELLRGEPAADVPEALAPLFRDSVQPYLMSWLPLDPAAQLAQVTCPALVVQGTTDLQVGVADAERLAAARDGVRLVLVPAMNHVLKQAPSDRQANLATYGDAQAPLAPELVGTLAEFVATVR